MADESQPAAPSPVDTAKLEVQAAMYKAQFSQATERLEENLNELFKHLENMAAHVVALEAVVSQMAQAQQLDDQAIVEEIRKRIAAGTEAAGDPERAINAARRLLERQV